MSAQVLSRYSVEAVLQNYVEPCLGIDLVTAKTVKEISIQHQTLKLILELGFPAQHYRKQLIHDLTHYLCQKLGITDIHIDVSWQIKARSIQSGLQAIPGIKNIIAVASGKGGVGKSTTATNLAIALQQEGAAVGILDADIYGPSQPTLLGIAHKADTTDKALMPITAHGLQTMSIGYLVDTQSAMIWRGPMVSSALQQLLKETQWEALDYLIIDLPPGTGDIQLTLAQKIPVSGAVIVTTPQDLALMDVERAYRMFEKVQIPILGLIENMSGHVCSQCGHLDTIFGEGGAERMSQVHQVPLLAQLPLDKDIRNDSDHGIPYLITHPETNIAKLYRTAARRLAALLSRQAKDYSKLFANIMVQPK